MVSPDQPYDFLYMVGKFDSICASCQKPYCSMGYWTGSEFLKVGAGLCSRKKDKQIQVLTAKLTRKGVLFVGGSFESYLNSGSEVVSINNVAQYDPRLNEWLPLLPYDSTGNDSSSGLGCNWCNVTVMSLAFNDQSHTLYIAGQFNLIGDRYIQPGLAIWTENDGLQPFPGGGLSYVALDEDNPDVVLDAVATSLLFDAHSGGLYVAGTFGKVNDIVCDSIAVWFENTNMWYCLHDASYSFKIITAIHCKDQMLYVAGVPSANSSWAFSSEDSIKHAIARMKSLPSAYSPKASLMQGASRMKPSLREEGGGNEYNKAKINSLVGNSSSNLNFNEDERKKIPSAYTQGGDLEDEEQDTYDFNWEWLPGFEGVNGEIRALDTGQGLLRNSIIIGGNFPESVITWTEDSEAGPTTSLLGLPGELEGFVTSIAQMDLKPHEVSGIKVGHAKGPVKDSNIHRWANTPTVPILIVCITIGVCLGVVTIICCFDLRCMDHPFISEMVDGYNGVKLTTLMGDNNMMWKMENDIKHRFNKAMQARHLWKVNTLNAVNPKEIMLHHVVGEGSYGRVWSGIWENSPVAVKEFVFAQTAISGSSVRQNELIEEIIGEAMIMSYLRHPRILNLYGCTLTPHAIWIVSELCNRGSLKQVLDDWSLPLSTTCRIQLAIDIADGMRHLHSRKPPIIHRDLKSHNIFVNDGPNNRLDPKIGDWGSARADTHVGGLSMTHGVGTVCWLAPEVIRDAMGGKASDVYAFGILLWELATRMEVHSGLTAAQIIARVAHEGLRPNVPDGCPWGHIMKACWHEDPKQRPCFDDVITDLEAVLKVVGMERHAYGACRTRLLGNSLPGKSPEFLPLETAITKRSATFPELGSMM